MSGFPQQIQGFLQLLSGDDCRKTFVVVQNKKLLLFTDDPQKNHTLSPFSVYDLNRVTLVENAQFSRPKSFGVSLGNGSVLEFSCPTNSVRSSWIKALSDTATSNDFVPSDVNHTMISATTSGSSGPIVLVHPSLVATKRRASLIVAPQSVEQRRASIPAPPQPPVVASVPSSATFAPSSSSGGMVKPVMKKAIGPLPG